MRMVSSAVKPGRHLHLKGHWETLVNSFKAESCYGNLAFQTNVIKIPPVPFVVPTLNHTFQIGRPPLEGVFSNASHRECMNRYDGFTRWHQTWVPCGNNKWNHQRLAMRVTHSQNIKQMAASSSFVWKPFSSIEQGCRVMTQSLIKKKKIKLMAKSLAHHLWYLKVITLPRVPGLEWIAIGNTQMQVVFLKDGQCLKEATPLQENQIENVDFKNWNVGGSWYDFHCS